MVHLKSVRKTFVSDELHRSQGGKKTTQSRFKQQHLELFQSSVLFTTEKKKCITWKMVAKKGKGTWPTYAPALRKTDHRRSGNIKIFRLTGRKSKTGVEKDETR
jgi:hypothetical protein